MAWVLALHVICMVAWFAGLFYLPRLFVYNADTTDKIGLERFKVMERKLYSYIMTPAAILTTLLGIWLFSFNPSLYAKAGWMQVKLLMVILLWIFHLYCGHLVQCFKAEKNQHSAKFYRFFNEIPTILLFIIVIMAIVKP